MSEPEDPSRMLEDASLPAGLRDVLRSAQSDVGSDAELSRLAGRLEALLEPPSPSPPDGEAPAPGATSSGMAGSAKLALGALALMTAGGAAWWLATSEPPSPPAKATPSAAAVGRPPVAPIEASAAVAPPAPAGVVLEPAPAFEPSARPLPAKPNPPPALSEAELLEQARSALKADPARALTRVNEHRARFPRGVLVQEREVIAIQALRQLGRSAEAERRAAAFSEAFPGSAFQRKLKPTP